MTTRLLLLCASLVTVATSAELPITGLAGVGVKVSAGDGSDYVEFILQPAPPTRLQRGAMDHISLEVADIKVAHRFLIERGMTEEQRRKPLLGIDRHWLMNVLDPDGTRTELMETRTVPAGL